MTLSLSESLISTTAAALVVITVIHHPPDMRFVKKNYTARFSGQRFYTFNFTEFQQL